MKKLIGIMLAAMFVVAFAGCGKKIEDKAPSAIYQSSSMYDAAAVRVNIITYMLNPKLAQQAVDADFVFIEQRAKEGRGRVLERRMFLALHLDKTNLAVVRTALKPIPKPGDQAVFGDAEWWPEPETLEKFQFFSTEGVFADKPGGFAACSADGEILYVYGEQSF